MHTVASDLSQAVLERRKARGELRPPQADPRDGAAYRPRAVTVRDRLDEDFRGRARDLLGEAIDRA